jgi:rsbT co-antagonist protein RsbR
LSARLCASGCATDAAADGAAIAVESAQVLPLLQTVRPALVQAANQALAAHVAHNGSALPPFRLPKITQQLLAGLDAFLLHGKEEDARTLGSELGRQGLGLRSLLAAGTAWARALAVLPREDGAAELLLGVHQFASLLTEGLSHNATQAIIRQRDELQRALERVVEEREAALHRVIQELSTPIIPVADHILVLPLLSRLERERASIITERLLAAVVESKAKILIVDVTGVPEIDPEGAATLLRMMRAVQLLGARPAVTGIRAELAAVLARSGVDLQGIVTLADLQRGIEWALGEFGLGITRGHRTNPRLSRKDG